VSSDWKSKGGGTETFYYQINKLKLHPGPVPRWSRHKWIHGQLGGHQS